MLLNKEHETEALQKIAYNSDELSAVDMRNLARAALEKREYVDGTKMADMLSGFVNSSISDENEAFAKQVTEREHRTLQQSIFRLFTACVKRWAQQEHYDLRNEATVKASREIVEKVNLNTPYI